MSFDQTMTGLFSVFCNFVCQKCSIRLVLKNEWNSKNEEDSVYFLKIPNIIKSNNFKNESF